MAAISSGEFFEFYAAALPVCLSILRQDRELKSLEFLPSSGALCMSNASGRLEPLFLRPDFAIGRTTMLNGHWQKQDPEFFARHIKNSGYTGGVVVVDIGANIGLFARQLLAMVGSCVSRVWCYEPDPTNFELLNRNLAAFSGLRAIEAGLSAIEGSKPLFRDPGNSGNYSLYCSIVPASEIPASDVSLLSVAEQANLWLEADCPIYYKSDTQGHDMAIAAAIGGDFWTRVSGAILELCPTGDCDYDPDSLQGVLEDFPYRAYADRPQIQVPAVEVMELLLNQSNRHINKDLLLWR